MSSELQKLAANRLHTRWSLVAFDREAQSSSNITVSDVNSDRVYSCGQHMLRMSKASIPNPSFQQFSKACQIAAEATKIPAGQGMFDNLTRDR